MKSMNTKMITTLNERGTLNCKMTHEKNSLFSAVVGVALMMFISLAGVYSFVGIITH